ncbi:MAG: hypothetical protein QNJ00_13800 [Woeseiaceae bacterium]|nr:hypothetical protein [Woeseiaceae bacterium]
MAEGPDRCYIVGDGEDDRYYEHRDEAMKDLLRQLDAASGSISLAARAGSRPLWQRLLGAKYRIVSYFAIEWSRDLAGLMFYDDAASEYRAYDPAGGAESTIDAICFGEYEPWPKEMLIEKAKAVRAIEEFVEHEKRPEWLSYECVR